MPVEQKLYEALAADATIQELLSGRIFPVIIPQKTPMPALVYHRVSGVPYTHMGAGYGLSQVRIRVDIWARTYAEAKDICEAVKRSVAAAPGFEKMIENSGPDWADEKTFRTSIDLICWEKEGCCYD